MAADTPPRPALTQRERLLNPWPRPTLRQMLATAVVLILLIWSLRGTGASLGALVESAPTMLDFLRRIFPPRWDVQPVTLAVPSAPEAPIVILLPRVVPYIIETLHIAVIGTLLGVILSFPFGLLAARNLAPHPLIYYGTRLLLNINRAIPDILFALIFVAAVGLGPFAGVLALGVGAIGALGKLYAEAIEAIDPGPALAVRATGATRLQTFVYGVLPQALPLIASYSLLLFEHNVRSATILGLVGAGGVGFILTTYISLFQYRELIGALILVIAMVTVIDWLSGQLRKQII
ncbi:MAG: phosphonate ABC transporter, permease protein PhnE [Chloroflexaceae bacterium]